MFTYMKLPMKPSWTNIGKTALRNLHPSIHQFTKAAEKNTRPIHCIHVDWLRSVIAKVSICVLIKWQLFKGSLKVVGVSLARIDLRLQKSMSVKLAFVICFKQKKNMAEWTYNGHRVLQLPLLMVNNVICTHFCGSYEIHTEPKSCTYNYAEANHVSLSDGISKAQQECTSILCRLTIQGTLWQG